MKQITLDLTAVEKSLQKIEENMLKHGSQAVTRLGLSKVLDAVELAEEIKQKLARLKELTK